MRERERGFCLAVKRGGEVAAAEEAEELEKPAFEPRFSRLRFKKFFLNMYSRIACGKIASCDNFPFLFLPDMFRLIADQNRRASERKLGLLLHDCIQIPR